MYNHIVSFGCMCSTAKYLREMGLRDNSSFFDWIDSNLKCNIELIKNDFADCLNRAYLSQDFPSCPHIVTNKRYGFSYVHCFNSKKTFEKQIGSITKRVSRQISNFKKNIKDGKTLLVYYCRNQNEQIWIQDNQDYLLNFIESIGSELVFIFNNSISVSNFAFKFFIVEANDVHKPFGGRVSYPITGNHLLNDWLIQNYDVHKRQKNLIFAKKNKKKRSYGFLDRIFNRLSNKTLLKI